MFVILNDLFLFLIWGYDIESKVVMVGEEWTGKNILALNCLCQETAHVNHAIITWPESVTLLHPNFSVAKSV